MDAHVQASQFGGVELDLRRLQVLAGHPHHPVHYRLAPAVLLYRHRLAGHRTVHRTVGQGLLRHGLGQPVELGRERLAARLRLALQQALGGGAGDGRLGGLLQLGLERLAVDGLGQGIRGQAGKGIAEVRLAGIGALRRPAFRRLRGVLGALLQGHVHRRHAVELDQGRVAAGFGKAGRSTAGRRHGRWQQSRLGILVEQRYGTAETEQLQRIDRRFDFIFAVGLGLAVGRQRLAVFGNGRLPDGIRRLRFGGVLAGVPWLVPRTLRGTVGALGGLLRGLLGIHVGEAGSLVVTGLRRFLLALRRSGLGLYIRRRRQQHTRGDGHGNSPFAKGLRRGLRKGWSKVRANFAESLRETLARAPQQARSLCPQVPSGLQSRAASLPR